MLGDNLKSLKELPDNSVDSVVTDPPYALTSIKKRFGKEGSAPAQYGTDGAFQRASRGFMGKEWDAEVPTVEFWSEVYRVLKPGGHVLSFGGTRTYHRMVVNIEDAGFEIRDQIMWLYGSGFPKSHNIGKAVDKRGGESIGWFGEWLVKWRKENNIPQSKIAELFPSKTGGLTGCVSNWELGNNLPTNEQFNLICKTFDLPFTSLQEAEREFIGTKTSGIGKSFGDGKWNTGEYGSADVVDITKGQSKYEGWGTALKPANEPICVARKPLSEKTIAENVIKWGTGGINIDGCRIEIDIEKETPTGDMYYHINNKKYPNQETSNSKIMGSETKRVDLTLTEGRFPANVILECICDEVIEGETISANENYKWSNTKSEDTNTFTGRGKYTPREDTIMIHTNPECPCKLLDKQSGTSKSCKRGAELNKKGYKGDLYTPVNTDYREDNTYGDKGGASRFFYTAKVSKKERNLGLDGFEEKNKWLKGGVGIGITDRENVVAKNIHPTVKPVKLMSYLCRLITPPNGVVLDPFMGSGSTGIAAKLEGFNFIGMEMDEEYMKIAEGRINNYEEYRQFTK